MGKDFNPSDALFSFKELLDIMEKELGNTSIQPQILAAKRKRLGQLKRIYATIEPTPFIDRLFRIGRIMADQMEKDPAIESFYIRLELKPNPDNSKQSYINMKF